MSLQTITPGTFSTLSALVPAILIVLWSIPSASQSKSPVRLIRHQGQPKLAASKSQQSEPVDPQLVIQGGHASFVHGVAFSHDGRLAVTGSSDNSACLWEVSTGRQIRRFIGHEYWLTDVAFSPDDQFVVTSSYDTTARLWHVASGVEVMRVKLGVWVWSIEFSPDGRFVLLGAPNRSFSSLWDLSINKLTKTFDGMLSTFTPHGSYVVANIDGLQRTVNIRSGSELARTGTETLVVSPYNGLVLINRVIDGFVPLSDVEASRIREIEEKASRARIVRLSPNKKYLLTASQNETILWDVLTARQIKRFELSTGNGHEVTFSPDSKFVLAPHRDIAVVYETATGKEDKRLEGHQKDRIWSMAVSPDARFIVTGSIDSFARMWDTEKGKLVRTFPWSSEGMSSVAFSPSGRFLLIGSDDKTAHLIELATGKDITLGDHNSNVTVVAFSPDGRYMLTGTKNGELRLWDAKSGTELWKLESLGSVTSGSFSPDGGSILMGDGEGTATLWDRESRSKIRSFEGRVKYTSTLALGLNNQFYRPVTPTAMSPDGKFILMASRDHNAQLWDRHTGEFIRLFEGHTQIVNSVSFSPNSRTVLTGSDDGTARLWDRETGNEVKRFEQDRYGVSSAKFSAKGDLVLTGGGPEVKLSSVSSGKELCKLITMGDDSWLVSTPDGRFDTNDIERIQHLNWVMPDEPLKPLPLEIFMRDYFQPKLMRRIFSGPPLDIIRSLSNLNRTQPTVEVVAVGLEPAVTDKTQRAWVKVKVSNGAKTVRVNGKKFYKKSGAYNLRIFRDGQLIDQFPRVSQEGSSVVPDERERWRNANRIPIDPKTDTYTHTFYDVRLPARAGVSELEFTAYAFNEDRVKSATSKPVVYPLRQPRLGVQPKAYIVTVGVDFTSARWRLAFARKGVADIDALLQKTLKSQFEVVPVQLLSAYRKNSDELVNLATRKNIQTVLNILSGRDVAEVDRAKISHQEQLQRATPDDLVILYIASHGYVDPAGKFYVIPSDIGPPLGVSEESLDRCLKNSEQSRDCENGRRLLQHSISSEELTQWIEAIDARQMALILDSCHSGAVTGPGFKPGPMGDRSFGQLSYDKGMLVLTATQAQQLETGSLALGNRSILTYALTQRSSGPILDLRKWLSDAEKEVPNLYRQFVKSDPAYTQINDSDQEPALFDFSKRRSAILESH